MKFCTSGSNELFLVVVGFLKFNGRTQSLIWPILVAVTTTRGRNAISVRRSQSIGFICTITETMVVILRRIILMSREDVRGQVGRWQFRCGREQGGSGGSELVRDLVVCRWRGDKTRTCRVGMQGRLLMTLTCGGGVWPNT